MKKKGEVRQEYKYMETSKPRGLFRKRPVNLKVLALIVLIVGCAVGGYTAYGMLHDVESEREPEILTVSTIEKLVDMDELSTYQAVYNGIASKENDNGGTDYYVSYEAKVNAGFNFSAMEIDVDHEAKLVRVVIPEVTVLSVNVDIGSLDYIFENKKADNETVSVEAYGLCEKDALTESREKKEICRLAEENARNMVCALVNPFLEQAFPDYRLEVE